MSFIRGFPPEESWTGSGDDLIAVPGSWHQQEDHPQGVGRFGYGTYRLTILLDPEIPVLGLRIPQTGGAAHIYWNGQRVYENGFPAASRAEESPVWKPGTVVIQDIREENELRVVSSNHHNLSAGILDPIYLGDPHTIFRQRQAALLTGTFVIGVLVMIGLYHLFLFMYRRRNRAPVWFGLICLLLAVMMFPSFLLSLFPNRRWRFLQLVSWVVGGLYSAIVLVTPTRVFSRLLFGFQMFTVAAGIVLILVLVRAIYEKQPGSVLFLTGFGVLFLATVNDILNALFIVRTVQRASPALVVFNFINSFLERMGPIVRRHNGFVDKYLGNGLMALFSGSAREAGTRIILGTREQSRSRGRANR